MLVPCWWSGMYGDTPFISGITASTGPRDASTTWRARVATAAALMGCGDGGGGRCPDELPSTCPTPAPTFSMDADPIIQSFCVGCHSPTGIEPTHPFDTYANVRAQISTFIMQVRSCAM